MLISLVLAVLQVAGGAAPSLSPAQHRTIVVSRGVEFRYVSGNSFVMRNPLPFDVPVRWELIDGKERGSLVVPAATEQSRVGVAFLTTKTKGPVMIFINGLSYASAANEGKPASPWPFLGSRLPRFDTTLVVVNPSDGREFFRTRIGVLFKREATDSIIRALMAQYELTMVGFQWPLMFVVAIEDPGIAWTQLLAFRQRLDADPFIAGTYLINHPLPSPPPGRTTRRSGSGWSRPPIPPPRGLAGMTDTSIVLPLPGEPGALVYRNILAVHFDDSTSGSTVRDVLRTSRGEIISGNPEAGEYIVRFADPGVSYDSVMSLKRRIVSFPGVGYATLIRFQASGPVPPNRAGATRVLRWVEGNTFVVCNTLPTEDQVEWEVYATTETGALVLPPRPAGTPCTESAFTTRNRGTVRLFRDGGILQVEANGSPPPGLLTGDTARPPLPGKYLVAPVDSMLSVTTEEVTGSYAYRNVFLIRFRESASGTAVRALLTELRGDILGGFDSWYMVRFPDPGIGLRAVDSLREAIQSSGLVPTVELLPLASLSARAGGGPAWDDPPCNYLRKPGAPSTEPAPECRIRNTRPPIPDYDYPDDSMYVTPELEGGWVYYRRLLSVSFLPTATGTEIRQLFEKYSAVIVGGRHFTGAYVIQVPDPGASIEALTAIRERIGAEPGVQFVILLARRSPPPTVHIGSHGEKPPRQAAGDTTRPLIPTTGTFNFPRDTMLTVVPPGDTVTIYYRNIFRVRFDDSTSGTTVRTFFSENRGEIIGGAPNGGAYVVRFPDPGPTYEDFARLSDQLNRSRGVQYAAPAARRSGFGIDGR